MMQGRIRRSEALAHADDWLLTYADMITLLLCFFVVFIVVSASKKNLPQPPAPLALERVQESTPPVPSPPLPLPEKLPDVFEGKMPFHDLGPADLAEDTPPPEAIKTVEPPPVPVAAAPAPEIVPAAAPPAPVDDAGPKGDRITTFEMNSAAFFASGSAVLSDSGKSILQGVAANLKSDRFQEYRITVEGHTDDTPIHTAQFPSNWELSTSRASAVVHFFLEQGLPAQRLRAAGYADTFPKLPNRDASGNAIPANQAENRRVVINLEKIEKTRQ